MALDQAIWITDRDAMRLVKIVEELFRRSTALENGAEALHEVLDSAQIVPQKEIPQDVVTMNSTVTVEDVVSGERRQVTLVYPEEADAQSGRISVLSPMGNALLGARAGERISIAAPVSARTARVIGVHFQPENSGQYEL